MIATTVRSWRRELAAEWRAGGWRGLLRRRGWTLALGVIAFYLVRDLLLYVILPMGIFAAVR